MRHGRVPRVPRSAVDAAPRFRRPEPADAIEVARELFESGARVDVLAVARRLGVSRATMHRWFGTRDQLVGELLDAIAQGLIADALSATRGRGDERVFDFTRRVATASAALAPLRATVEEEPSLVLHVMLDDAGPIRTRVIEVIRDLLASTRTAAQVRRLETTISTYVDAAMAVHWASLAAGREPDPERLVVIGRALFAVAEAPRRSRSR